MAGATILIVDDAPVSLKLTAILLRNEGHQVRVASNAEEALSMLRTFHPDLMLVDLQLPGVNGLELTRRVKQDARTRGIAVVALTASAMKRDEQEAAAAGCDGYITKPVDIRTLGSRIREYLEKGVAAPPAAPLAAPPAAPESAPFPGGLSLSDAEMESLRRSFLAEGVQQSRQLLASLGPRFDGAHASRLLHKWVGAAGLLGYSAISGLAREIETLLSAPGWDAGQLREPLSNLVFAFADPYVAAQTPLPESMVQELSGKRIALIGFGEVEADRLCAALESVGARPRLFGASDPPDFDAIRECNVVMVHARPETAGAPWLTPGSPVLPGQPLVLVGGRERLLALDPSIQSRAREFLIDGWQPEEALMRLRFALSRDVPPAAASPAAAATACAPPAPRPVTGRAEILIADDDDTVLTVVRAALQNFGMECREASTGLDALRMVRDYRPHAAVLDVNMPGMDGFEVLAAIRAEGLPVRVVLLTGRQQEQDVLRGFTLGADDYVVKPFSPMELVARLKRLLRR
jgi:DNA-binding response OmpR family regulator